MKNEGGGGALRSDLETKLLFLLKDLESFRQRYCSPNDFNIFDAVGLERQEIKHSNLLSFLLTPQRNHGLEDSFLKWLIQKAAENVSEPPLSQLKIALADFSDAIVQRERQHIDLLIESATNQFVFVIENKIDSTESERQLEKYEDFVCAEYPNHTKLFCYLTREGDLPSRETWARVGYSELVKGLQDARTRAANLSNHSSIVIDHYLAFVRRKIVPDQELIDECRRGVHPV